MKQLLLLVAVYALIINQSNRHFFKKDQVKQVPVSTLEKSAAPRSTYPPRLAVTAMITRFATISVPKAQH